MSLHPLFARSAAPHFSDPKTRKIVERWAALAEQRLDYLTELFDSGRWRRFHGEAEFLDNIAEAKDAVARWQAMANGEFVAPVIRAAPPLQPVLAAIEAAIVAPVEQQQAEVLSFEDHAAQRDTARRPHFVAMSDVIVNHAEAEGVVETDEAESPVHAVSPLDLFDHDAIVARYPMLRAAM
ncbi:TIGR03809 family protein [Rhodopseudomonas boonkerdii]|uniref:TIGR03809 family protein n=1 Tax=Rhodopseudomonas boonkerdii TaxID=475937 RepID=UPI001E29324E|nr:TIGR03809 family protein [Rhodopseudomonas boonkerdii]